MEDKREFESVWSSEVRQVLSGGRFVAPNSNMWVYRKMPLSPVIDARDSGKMLDAAAPLEDLFQKLANQAQTFSGRRALAKSSYREVHTLLVNIPDLYQPPAHSPIAERLRADFGDRDVQRRLLVVGVRLIPKMVRKGQSAFSAAVDSITHTLTSSGAPLEDYEADYEVVDKIMRDSGLVELGTDAFGRSEQNLARYWYNFGHSSASPLLVHADHLHHFSSVRGAQTARILQARDLEETNFIECERWKIPGSYAMTMATISDLELDWVPFDSPLAHWMVALLDKRARAVSMRFRVEPAKITRKELKRHRDGYRKDIQERAIQSNSTDGEQTERENNLSEMEDMYARGGGPPTLTDISTVIAFDGQIPDIRRHLGDRAENVELSSLLGRQRSAFYETMLCSPVVSTPHRMDLPSQSFSTSGVVNLSTVGDKDGALLGLTEYDRQPSYISPASASAGDAPPFFAILGQTGVGKTMGLLHLARQWITWPTQRGWLTPVVLIDPKAGQDFSEPVEKMGGKVYSLDNLVEVDGALDPIRVMAAEEAVQVAHSLLSAINPWGRERREAFEVPLLKALTFGVANGGTCIIHALRIADAATPLPKGMLQPIIDLVESSPLARAIIGLNPGGTPLRDFEGLTLIRAGRTSIPLPDPGVPWADTPLMQRIGTWVLRMMVYGAASAVSYREGVVILDEAWQFMVGPSGASEIQRLSRLARSMQFLMVLASQRVSDFIDANLTGGISRGLILPLERGTGMVDPQGNKDDGQAGLALDLFKIERSEMLLSRLAAMATKEGSDTPNWASMRPLKDPETGRVVRGSVGLHVDLTGRVVPVEITIPPTFLREISTTSSDVIAREKAKAAREGSAP